MAARTVSDVVLDPIPGAERPVPTSSDWVPVAGAQVLRLAGEMDLGGAPALALELREAVTRCGAPSDLIVDLAAVSFMDASGLAALVAAHRWADRSGVRLQLTNARAMIRELLRITRLEQVLSVIEAASSDS